MASNGDYSPEDGAAKIDACCIDELEIESLIIFSISSYSLDFLWLVVSLKKRLGVYPTVI
jgi:hypothetical protein